ncbi:MAG: beta-galactosidase [Bacteroidetes bacterium]|nr:beta-galactosidase [Bacteroidota bacterium]MBU1116427.1 beta-galactosidase [Bacteroidota bacterium]MBU1800006.1 beta-galactosidase [Bacteroidota bacterium]
MLKNSIAFILIAFCIFPSLTLPQNKIDLSGNWQFEIDPLDIGIKEKWYAKNFSDTIKLPGSMTENNKGDDVSLNTDWTGDIIDSSFFFETRYEKFRDPQNFKIPFWLQPIKHYVGPAWYKREFEVPAKWANKQLEIFLERCHWQSTVWIDDVLVGSENSLSTAHEFLTDNLSAGNHSITIRIDNRINEINPGVNSHSITDHTQTNWNGIIGELSITHKSKINIENIKISSNLRDKKIEIKTSINNLPNKVTDAKLRFIIRDIKENSNKILKEIESDIKIKSANDSVITIFDYENILSLWNEFEPNLYSLSAELVGNDFNDTKKEIFGIREISVDETQFRINGELTFLRGTLECSIFPKTGYPPMDTMEWTRIFKIAKSFGLNHMRFHSWCPPEAAFVAADKIGLYLEVESPSWANQGSSVGDGKPIDQYIYEESEKILEKYGNHPSFCFLLYGNEPAGKNHKDYLSKLVSHWKNIDNRRLYAGSAGWPSLEVNDFNSSYEPRIQLWGAGVNSIINAENPKSNFNFDKIIQASNKPIVSHEIGQWCVYPNFKEVKKYDGVLYPKNFEIFKEFLDNNNLSNLADDFLYASGKLQTLCYKADIEAALRTKNMGGFQLLDLHDFPGQGTALVGVLDPFWDEKGYVTAAEYSQFCNSTVPLAQFPKFIFNSSEKLDVPVEVAHFGSKPLLDVTPSWKILDMKNNILASGMLDKIDIPLGNDLNLGNIVYSLNSLQSPAMYRLEVTINNFKNDWDFWVYPYENDYAQLNESVKIVQELDSETIDYIESGGTVILTPIKGSIKNNKGGDIAVGFSSIFWNTAWTHNQPPHTLGILCNPKHPMLNEFPTQSFSNYQWWDAMSHSNAILLSELGANVEPTVRIIDDWFTARSLGLIVESKVGKGKIILTGIDLITDAEKRPEARQLLYSMLKYANSDSFNPPNVVEINKIKGLFN